MEGIPPPGQVDTSPGEEKTRFLRALRTKISNGNYGQVARGTNALGAYGVPVTHLEAFLSDAGMPAMTDQKFLEDWAAQDQLAWRYIGGMFDRWGIRGTAITWYHYFRNGSTDVTIGQAAGFAARVEDLMGLPAFPAAHSSIPAPAAPIPAPPVQDPTPPIRAATATQTDLAARAFAYAAAISYMVRG